MARLSVTVAAAVCCASLLGISTSYAQNLPGGARPIQRGPVDVPDLTRRANLVVHGFVTGRTTTWVGRVIYTVYDVSVQETLKGGPRTSVSVAVVGGARGNVRLTVPGAPDLLNGEQVVIFATPLQGQGATFTPVGTFDGVVPVRQGNGGAGATVAPRGRPEDLNAFLEEVRQGGR